jgi:hypothetical protein
VPFIEDDTDGAEEEGREEVDEEVEVEVEEGREEEEVEVEEGREEEEEHEVILAVEDAIAVASKE